MKWSELKEALNDHDSDGVVEVLINDEYVAVELAITHKGVMFLVPKAED